MTIMSLGCAQRLGLERLIDRRFQGTAKGVGTQKIIGKVHQAPITIADVSMPCAITVLEKEQDMDFIFGLDMLKRHQCCVDLEKNELRVGSIGKAVPFLGEHALPASAKALTGEDEKSAGDEAGAAGPAAGSGPAETEAAGLSGSAATVAGGTNAGSVDASPAPAPAPGASTESKIAKLVELGFDRAKCAEALEASGGNEEYAASLLFSGF
jgi:DNA damage-inducible protein 1